MSGSVSRDLMLSQRTDERWKNEGNLLKPNLLKEYL